MTSRVAAAVALSVAVSAFAGPADAGSPSAARTVARLEKKKAEAEKKAKRDVGRWSNRKLTLEGWRPAQRDKAIAVRTKQRFGRHDRRALDAAKMVVKLEKQGKTADASRLTRAASLNRKLGVERNWYRLVRRGLQLYAPFLGRVVPWLKRDTAAEPGTVASNLDPNEPRLDMANPVDSPMWEHPSEKRTSTAALYYGAWMKAKNRPTLPAAETVLEYEEPRDLDADGFHPSVKVIDPETGIEWKAKFTGIGHDKLTSEPITARLLHAMGYNTTPGYYGGQTMRIDPRAVIAARRYKNKIGFRLGVDNWFGFRPQKVGWSPHKVSKHVASVTTRRGKTLTGWRALWKLRRAEHSVAALEDIAFVTLRGMGLELEEKGAPEAIGPFKPDDAEHIDRREMRALSIISATWLDGNDTRMSNLRLDAEENDETGEIELTNVVSDTGSTLRDDPDLIGWEVSVNPASGRLHSDRNLITMRAFDRTTMDDARWAVRQIAGLSEAQIFASVASGTSSYPVARLMTEKLISRRDDLVKKFGLAGEIKPLRPNGADRNLTVHGGGTFRLRDEDGAEREEKMGDGGFAVVNGRVVAATAAATTR